MLRDGRRGAADLGAPVGRRAARPPAGRAGAAGPPAGGRGARAAPPPRRGQQAPWSCRARLPPLAGMTVAGPLQTLLSESLPKAQWLELWDHLIAHQGEDPRASGRRRRHLARCFAEFPAQAAAGVAGISRGVVEAAAGGPPAGRNRGCQGALRHNWHAAVRDAPGRPGGGRRPPGGGRAPAGGRADTGERLRRVRRLQREVERSREQGRLILEDIKDGRLRPVRELEERLRREEAAAAEGLGRDPSPPGAEAAAEPRGATRRGGVREEVVSAAAPAGALDGALRELERQLRLARAVRGRVAQRAASMQGAHWPQEGDDDELGDILRSLE
ncbi:unnamed protein product, partial [Prorocentrum cordatum]